MLLPGNGEGLSYTSLVCVLANFIPFLSALRALQREKSKPRVASMGLLLKGTAAISPCNAAACALQCSA